MKKKIYKKVKSIFFKSEFNSNVLTLMVGTTIAQAIPIAITPILTRIYTPEDFGILALFIGLTAIFGTIANARYELAIMLPEKDEDAINIAALGLLIAIFLSLVLLISAIVLNEKITNLLNNEKIGFWLYFVPFVVLMMGSYNVLNYLNNRKKLYKNISVFNVYKAMVSATVQLSVGFIKSGATGLISGQIISSIVTNYFLAKNTKANYRLQTINKERMFELAGRYNKFPKYTMWAVLANSSSQHLTTILISGVYSVTTLGFYFLTQKLLFIPASVISQAIEQVFYQEAAEEKAKTSIAVLIFKKTLVRLFLLSLIIYFLLYWVIVDLFIFAFGESWAVAGEYAKILIPLFFIQFFVSPLAAMNMIFEKNEVGMCWQFILLLLHIALILLADFYNLDFESYLYLVVWVIGAHYLILLFIISRYNKLKNI
jgi:hypothetical protein